MARSPSPQPHDALFKATFEIPRHARALLTEILPPGICAAIEWSSLARESGNFIDPVLGSLYSDLLFSVRLAGEPALVYVLLEHQSEVDPKMPLRVADYLVRVWKRFEKEHGLPLPLLVPVTICHVRGGWTGPTSLHEIIRPIPASLPELAPLTLELTLFVFDLGQLDDAQLHEWALQAFPKLALLLLRDARDPERLRQAFMRWRHLFLEVLHADNGADAVAQVLRYVAQVASEVDYEEFRATIVEQHPEVEEIAMTFAEQLHQQGLQQGLQEGRQEGRQEGLQQGRAEQLTKLIQLKFGALTPELAVRIQAASIEALDRYSQRILSAETIEELLAG